jgi:hypothetical protein
MPEYVTPQTVALDRWALLSSVQAGTQRVTAFRFGPQAIP